LTKDIEAVASTAPVPFHWSDEDILLLYGPALEVRAGRADEVGGVEEKGEQVFRMRVNTLYMYKPNDEEAKDVHGVPFRLALCMQRGRLLDELLGDDVLYPGAYMLEYKPTSPDWENCKWKPQVKKRPMQSNMFQWDISVTPWPMVLTQKKYLTVRSATDMRYYLERWARPELSENWPEQAEDGIMRDVNNILRLDPTKPRKPKLKTGNKKKKK
jgi:hypothetical protein